MPSSVLSLFAFLLLSLTASHAAPEAEKRPPVRLDCALMIFSEWHLDRAVAQLDRMAADGVRGVSVVLTLQCHVDAEKRVTDIGLTRAPAGRAYTNRWGRRWLRCWRKSSP